MGSDLASLDRTRVESWLANRIFGCGFSPSNNGRSLDQPLPALKVVPPTRSREPVGYWLFSPQAVWLKAACALAVVLAVLTCGFTIREYHGRWERSAAYEQMKTARESRDYNRMLDAAERFLAHPVVGNDSRTSEVQELYSEALVRWFNESRPPLSDVQQRTERYRKLLGITAKESHP